MARLLSFDHLSVSDQRHIILAGLDMHIEGGEKVALVGESGSGKTMSIRSLLHLLPDDVFVTGGSVNFCGEDVLSYTPRERQQKLYGRIGFVPQNTSESLHPQLRVQAQMTDFYLERHRDIGKKEAAERAAAILKSLGLEDVERILKSHPGQLSGGMRQRINIAIALMDDITLMIADEPTSALDAHVRRQIEELYAELASRRELAMLIVSHDLGFVRRFAQRVYVMYAGKIVEEGLVDEIFTDPVHPYTRALISLSNVKHRDKNLPLAELGGYQPAFEKSSPSCAFASLCRYAKDECLTGVGYRALSESHYVRCVR